MNTGIRAFLLVGIISATFSFTAVSAHTNATAGEVSHMQEMALADALYTKVQSGERTCASLSDADFELLGEHFMQVVLGDMHESANAKFTEVLSHEGEEEMHLVIGKQGTHCASPATGTDVQSGGGMASAGIPGLIGKLFLWIFALYGAVSLMKKFFAKKVPSTEAKNV